MNKLAVIALGGNALLRDNQAGSIEEQEENTTETLENIIFLLKEGYNLVLTHGNGPQVGNIVMQNDAGEQMYDIPQMPLDICVASTQGSIGYMIERCLRNVLLKHGIHRNVLSLISLVEVNADDEAFENPTKRTGRIVNSEQAEKLTETKGWVFKKESKQTTGYRRVVPSPQPIHIMNWEVIERNARNGTIVIAAGGGGVPVYFDKDGTMRPSEAVIDKDLASSLLASQIKAEEFYILTDVAYVYADYKGANQKILEFLDYDDATQYLDQGMFGEGSMAPKIKAALHFVGHGGQMSVITEAKKLEDKTYGSKITMEYDPKDLEKYK